MILYLNTGAFLEDLVRDAYSLDIKIIYIESIFRLSSDLISQNVFLFASYRVAGELVTLKRFMGTCMASMNDIARERIHKELAEQKERIRSRAKSVGLDAREALLRPADGRSLFDI
jgi:hypothetical protein